MAPFVLCLRAMPPLVVKQRVAHHDHVAALLPPPLRHEVFQPLPETPALALALGRSGGDRSHRVDVVIGRQPRMLEGLRRARTPGRVHHQQEGDEGDGGGRDGLELGVLERVAQTRDVVEGLLVVGAEEGGETGEKDVRDDADGPHVRRQGDRVVIDDLGRDELGRPLGHADVGRGIEATGEAEVDDFNEKAL